MDQRTVERVEEWDSRPVPDGYEGLRELADADFSGAVTGGMAWAFLLNGRVVGVFEGSMESFEEAGLTAYAAPDPSVALLFAMKETGGETRANYYTNDTPISEADRTLSSGSFTGYLELSENVLSGDYFVCYYGGKSMSCAFVGNSERLITGDEAFDKADNEVGIYEVFDVELDVQDVPDPEPDEPADGAAAGGAVADAPEGGDGGSDPKSASDGGAATGAAGSTPAEAGTDPTPDAAPDDAVAADPAHEETNRGAPDDAVAADPAPEETNRGAPDDAVAADPAPDDAVAADPAPNESDDAVAAGPAAGTDDGATAADAPAERGPAGGGTDPSRQERGGSAAPEVSPEEAGASWDPDLDEADASAAGADAASEDPEVQELIDAAEAEIEGEDDERFEREQQWRETTSIPSLDPDQSAATEGGQPAAEPRSAEAAETTTRTDPSAEAGGQRREASRSGARAASTADTADAADGATVKKLKARLSELQEERDGLAEDRERFRSRVDELEAALEDREATIDELEREIESLESQVDRLEGDLEDARQAARDAQDGPTTASQQLTPRAALEGTNLFVRYGSKGEATLEDARDDVASPDAVNENLRIERHTQFDESDVAVDGQDFAQFLTGTTAFQFVEWVIRDLLFEIRDTGNADAMGELYDVLPSIDRAELHGVVDVHRQEDGDEVREQVQFDVVLRDRMGHPLVLANVNDSRDPASQDMMTDLQTAAQDVKRTHDQLGAAVLVTTSFFDPGALETAEEATSGSFLSRDSRKSYVKLSRKQGYHLCLVETRGGKFHINVPEL